MKLLFTIVASFGLLASSHAASSVYSTNIMTTNKSHYLLSGPITVDSITLLTTNTGTIVRLYDNGSASAFYTNDAYVNMVSYASNYVTEHVDTFGVTNSYTNSVLFVQRNTNAAATSALPVRAMFLTHTSFVTQGTDLGYFAKGLVLSNDVHGIQAIVYYRRP